MLAMTTLHIAHTAPINPPGSSPTITASQAWAGLQRKARRPQDFVPVVDTCEIHAEVDNVISCTVVFKSDASVAHAMRITETCTLSAPCRLDYKIEDGSSAVNVISSGAGGELFLTFAFAWRHEGLVAGSDEARALEQKYREVGPSHRRIPCLRSPCDTDGGYCCGGHYQDN